MSNVQIVFPPSEPTGVLSWTVSAVLAIVPDFTGRRWGTPVDDDADLVVFITGQQWRGQTDLDPIRIAIRAGLNVFIVTGGGITVTPVDLGEITGEGRVWFFHVGKSTAQGGFLPFRVLGPALQRLFSGLPLADLGKEE